MGSSSEASPRRRRLRAPSSPADEHESCGALPPPGNIAWVPPSRSTGSPPLAPTVTLVTDPAATKMMSLRYAGTCSACGIGLPAGARAAYDRASRTVNCAQCSTLVTDDLIFEAGTAGASALREFEKRKDKRETRIRAQHPHLGGVILALTDEPQRTRAWSTGAEGEVVLGPRLDAAVGVRVLHDRRIPGSKANIDHIAIGPRGVFVIDAKHYKGGPTLRTSGGLFSPRVEKLMIGSRDHTSLVAGVHKQVRKVDVTSPGSLGGDEIEAVFRSLALQFPPA